MYSSRKAVASVKYLVETKTGEQFSADTFNIARNIAMGIMGECWITCRGRALSWWHNGREQITYI